MQEAAGTGSDEGGLVQGNRALPNPEQGNCNRGEGTGARGQGPEHCREGPRSSSRALPRASAGPVTLMAASSSEQVTGSGQCPRSADGHAHLRSRAEQVTVGSSAVAQSRGSKTEARGVGHPEPQERLPGHAVSPEEGQGGSKLWSLAPAPKRQRTQMRITGSKASPSPSH